MAHAKWFVFLGLIVSDYASTFAAEAINEPKQPRPVEELRNDCFTKDDFGSCVKLAQLLRNGSDETERQKVLMKLCAASDGGSCMHLGLSAERAKLLNDAASWYRKACDTGYEKGAGCAAMAKMASGQNSKANAKVWLKKACGKGHSESCLILTDEKKVETKKK